MIRYAGLPVAERTRLVPRDVAERGRTSRVAFTAEVGKRNPVRVAVYEDEVAAPKMSRHCVVLTYRLWVVIFRFLAEENRVGGTRCLIAPESNTGAAFLVPARAHRIHEIWTCG